MFNENKEKQAFVLENETDNEVYVVYSEERYMKEGQILVKMLHGDSILSESSSESNEKVKEILNKAEKYNSEGIHWHHHMLFPNCIYNKNKGKFSIVFGDTQENEVIEIVYDTEPKEDLRKIEVLYYEQGG